MNFADTLAFWGKARPDNGGAAYHPALLHCVDVAACAHVLLPRFRASLAEDIAANLPFLAALHDIGKFSRPFQAQAPEHWPEVVLGELDTTKVGALPHDRVGLALLTTRCGGVLDDLFAACPRVRAAVLRAVAFHHGRPWIEEHDDWERGVMCPASTEAAIAAVGLLRNLFAPLPFAARSVLQARQESWLLAGIIALADWIGSGAKNFPYVEACSVHDLRQYWEGYAQPAAQRAVAAAGLAPAVPAPWRSIQALLPSLDAPRPMQQWAASVALPEGAPLFVIEDATGSGKTEAALILAHRLLAAGRADGVFIGLPTMATANAMYRRLAPAYRALFAKSADASLALAHGRAALNSGFSESLLADAPPPDELGDAEPAGATCRAWLAADRRRALLAQVGVGTIDQALLAVLPTRHAPLRMAALARKVLILDEVHAYDTYMQQEILALVSLCALHATPVILLSATLTEARRAELLERFAPGATPSCIAYPLASVASRDGVREQAVPMQGERCVAVERLGDSADAVAAIAAAAQAGAAVAWVRNTVDDAIAAHAMLREAGIAATLFHARFALCDRLAIERAVLDRFGPTVGARSHVLVATQVIEQSLDLDFDLVVSDAAPVDLLIQRAGRLWRHAWRQRPLPAARLLVLGPDPVEDPPPDWLSAMPGTQAIYGAWLVWRSLRALCRACAIETPAGIRALIEDAYAEHEPPPGMCRHFEKRKGKEGSRASVAGMNVLALDEGYARQSGAWDPDTRTPTRLEEQAQATLRLARLRDGAVVPYADDPNLDRAWALSEVQVAAHRIGALAVPAGLEAAMERARSGWGRWERDARDAVKMVVLEPMRSNPDLTKERQTLADIRYSAKTGLTVGEGN